MKKISKLLPLLASAFGIGLMPFAAQAVGTVAGTPITNTAQVSYTSGVTTVNVNSNTTTLTVAEIVNVNVTVQTPSVSVAAGAAQRVVVVRVTNTGNGPETFRLTGNSVVAGDDFDPVPNAPFIYFDTDGSGDLSAADIAYTPGGNDPVLTADQFATVLIVNSIPAGLTNGAAGRTQLTANSLTGTGAPGTVFAGQGVGGVDAVIGTSGGTQIGTGTYVVTGLQITAVKSQVIVDQFGGAHPIPGARINYHLVITPSGSGSATGVIFTDAIPTNTTYVAGSMQFNGAAVTDVADADAGQFVTVPSNQVRVSLGTLTTASGVQTIDFAVTIN